MYQYGKTKGKKIVLQTDSSGKANQEQLYASIGNDNENYLENLGGDSDTEFILVTEEAREALITSDNDIEVEDTTSTTGDVQRSSFDMENLEAVVPDTIVELSPVSPPTSSRICINNRTDKSIRKRKLFYGHDLTDRNMVEPIPKPEAKKCKMQLKTLQSTVTPTPSAVNDDKAYNKNKSWTLRLKTTIAECCQNNQDVKSFVGCTICSGAFCFNGNRNCFFLHTTGYLTTGS